MPCVTIDRDKLFGAIGRTFSDTEFDQLCFTFGIELDDITTRDGKVYYKIEIPANRCELLCIEGLSYYLGLFLCLKNINLYQVCRSNIVLFVDKSVDKIRPFIVCAILRDIDLSNGVLESLIDFQEKLHQNICRKRSLVAIGTHDLDTIRPPFYYSADDPKSIRFRTLTLDKEYNGDEILEIYKNNKLFKNYVELIDKFDRCPIVRDSNGTVLSLPPIINGYTSRLTESTKNIFIECTATDLGRAKSVLNALVTCFSHHSKYKNIIQSVEISSYNTENLSYPKFENHEIIVNYEWLNQMIGMNIPADEHCSNLYRMGYITNLLYNKSIKVFVPPNRSDVIHKCDVMEDAAIAYGINRIQEAIPEISIDSKMTPLNRFSEHIRFEMATMTYTETLSFVLCSYTDLIDKMNLAESSMESSMIPVSLETTYDNNCVRNSLLPGLLKTISCNRKLSLPIKIFEVSDIVVVDDSNHNKASNCRHLCAVYCGTTSGFELIHGVLDRIMSAINVPPHFINSSTPSYKLLEYDCPFYFSGRACRIYIHEDIIGHMGIVNPNVLKNFEIHQAVCSAFELDLEKLLKFFKY